MRLSTLFAPIAALTLSAAAAPPLGPASAVVLVVAGWCAPCRDEIAHREAIAIAARPRVVRVVALDNARSTRAMLAGVPVWAVWNLTPSERLRLAEAVFSRSPGLPYAFATDAAGRRCADVAGELDAAHTRALVARCAP